MNDFLIIAPILLPLILLVGSLAMERCGKDAGAL